MQMDRILKEERNYILQMVKKIRASGANVLLVQKSILRDATTDLSLHYLARAPPSGNHQPHAHAQCNWDQLPRPRAMARRHRSKLNSDHREMFVPPVSETG